jgi:hypothetical protein
MLDISEDQYFPIPPDYSHLMPSPDMPVSSLLETPLPTTIPALDDGRSAGSYITSELPSWTLAQLKSARVPSREWLTVLNDTIAKRSSGDARSIEHPDDSTIRFPLWVGTFWTPLLDIIQEQKRWRNARKWVLALPTCNETRELVAAFDRIPRQIYVWILPLKGDRESTTIDFFANLLSERFLAERHIDAFVVYLNIQARRSGPNAAGILVADLPLSENLKQHHDAHEDKIVTNEVLAKYAELLRSTAYRTLLFPAHVGHGESGHWVCFRVDFEGRKYCYGERHRDCPGSRITDLAPTVGVGNSLPDAAYRGDIRKLCSGIDRWTETYFDAPFENLGRTLQIGTQTDGSSCGVCVQNALEHALFGTELFTPGLRKILRVRYFMKIINLLMDPVSGNGSHFPTVED